MTFHEHSSVKSVLACLAIALAAVLSGCGGGGGDLPLMVDSLGRQVPEADFGGGEPGAAGADGTAVDGGPIINGEVSLADNAGNTRTASTDGSGYYRVDIKGLTPPFVLKVNRSGGAHWFSASASAVKTRGFVTINLTGLTDKVLSYVADAASIGGGAAGAVTPAVLAANPSALAAAKSKLTAGLAVPLINASLDPAAYDPVTTPAQPAGADKHAAFLQRLTINKNDGVGPRDQGRTVVIGTLAGAGGYLLDGPGATATFNRPDGVARDGAGNLYVADSGNSVIRKISPGGLVSTFAGGGAPGYTNAASAAAAFRTPAGVAVDANGNVYVADTGNHVIRKITTGGMVTTLAGGGVAGFADGTGTLARFSGPVSVAVDAAGSVYVADRGNSAIRKITPDGVVTTFAGIRPGEPCCLTESYFEATGVAVDGAGNVYVAPRFSGNRAIRKITPAGVGSNLYSPVGDEALAFNPYGIAVDAGGTVYVTDPAAGRVRKITSDGAVSTLAGGISSAAGIAVDPSGNAFVAEAGNNAIRKVTAAGEIGNFAGSSTGATDGTGMAALLNRPAAVAVADGGDIYVADTGNHAIRRISRTGAVTTFAGSGSAGFANGNGSSASFNAPTGVALDGSGNLYVADSNNNVIRKITRAGSVSTFAGSGAAGFANGLGTSATFSSPSHVAVDRDGNVYVSDVGNVSVRKVTAGGLVTTVVGTGRVTSDSPEGLWDQVGPIAVDAAGVVYFDARCTYLPPVNRIKVCIFTVSPDGVVGRRKELAGSNLYVRAGLAVDSHANLYSVFATSVESRKGKIFKLTPEGVETEVATEPRLNGAKGIAFDGNSNLVVADSGNSAIRIVLP